VPAPARHVTLDDNRPPVARASLTPGIAVGRIKVPEIIDRPQLVLHTDSNQVSLSEQYRWAEPLRREIPRLIASDLGELLDSSRVAALAAEEAGFPVDFKLTLDFQQLDAVVGQGVDVDVLWRLEHRNGTSFVGRSSFRQPLTGLATEQTALIPTHRSAVRHVSSDIAKKIADWPNP